MMDSDDGEGKDGGDWGGGDLYNDDRIVKIGYFCLQKWEVVWWRWRVPGSPHWHIQFLLIVLKELLVCD